MPCLLRIFQTTPNIDNNSKQHTMNKRGTRREMGYNGHANYETWTLSVWDYISFLTEDAQAQDMSACTAEWCEETMYDVLEVSRLDGIISDWVNATLAEIDWREVAEMVNENLSY